jgi:hypothetical protein
VSPDNWVRRAITRGRSDRADEERDRELAGMKPFLK